MAELFVSVVVPAEHADGSLGGCLASLASVDYPPERYEVLVVGDRSRRNGTLATAARYGARHVTVTRRGVGSARNAGVDASRGEIIAFTDADCTAATGWLRELAAAFSDETVGAVAGTIVPYPPETDAERYAARRRSHSELRPLGHPERPFAMAPNLALRRHAFSLIGGFDETFPGGGWEDADLCWRLARTTDLTLGYAPRAVVFHRYRTTSRAFLAQHYRYGYGLGVLLRKYRTEVPSAWLAGPHSSRGVAGHTWAWLRGGEERASLKFDLLRALGQRAGFLHATALARNR